jgi:hypothetical protein
MLGSTQSPLLTNRNLLLADSAAVARHTARQPHAHALLPGLAYARPLAGAGRELSQQFLCPLFPILLFIFISF